MATKILPDVRSTGIKLPGKAGGKGPEQLEMPKRRLPYEKNMGDVEVVEPSKLPSPEQDAIRAGERVKTATKTAAKTGLSRASLLGASLGAGLAIGDYIEEKTGFGKKLVDAVAGDIIDKITLSGREPAKLSEYSQARLRGLVDAAIERQSKGVKEDTEPQPKKETSKESTPVASKTKSTDYPVYEKDSEQAKAFRAAFREARNEGKDIFTFEGRKYTTELKKTEMAKGGMAKKKKSVAKPKAFSVGGYAKKYGKK